MTPSRELRELLRATLPMFVGLSLVASVGVVDAYWVGRLGVEPLAAFSCALPVVVFLQSLVAGFSAAVTSLGARAIGRGDQDELHSIARVSFGFLLGVGTLLAFASCVLRQPYLVWVGAEGRVASLAAAYLLPILVCIIPYSVCLWGVGLTRAIGDIAFTPWAMLSAAALNFVLCPLFVFGLGPVPPMGMLGAGYATAAAFLGSALLALVRLRGYSRRRPGAPGAKTQWRAVLGEGLPAMVSNSLWPVGAAMMLSRVGHFGDGATAAMGIIGRVENLILMMPTAVSAALMPLVGRAWASNDRPRAARLLRAAQKVTVVWGVVVYAYVALWAHGIATLFGDTAAVVDATILGLRLVPLSYVTGGVMIVTSASFLSIGRPRRTMQLSALVNLAILPVTMMLARPRFALAGTYVAFVVTITLGMLMALYWWNAEGCGTQT